MEEIHEPKAILQSHQQLDFSLWNPEQRVQQTHTQAPNLQKLQDSRSVLFQIAKFVVVLPKLGLCSLVPNRNAETEFGVKENRQPMGICCMAQETQTGALYNLMGWDGEWNGREVQGGGEYMYTYGWFMLRFDRKQQNYIKQLSFNNQINLKQSSFYCFARQRGAQWANVLKTV